MPIAIHRLNLASVKLQGKYNPPTFVDGRINVYAYLLIASGAHTNRPADVILIDSGIGSDSAYIDETFAPTRHCIVDAIARFGVAPADVDILINSHLHFDHCGNNKLFSNADIFVQEEELHTARTTRHTIRQWFDYAGARLVAVSGDTDICPGVTLLSSPGHTPGHQSVLVQNAGERALVAAQAAFTAAEFDRGGDPDTQAHDGLRAQYLVSIARLKALRANAIYFSHDATVATSR